MTKRIVISGFGGQGVLTLGGVIAQIGLNKGLHVTWMPSYGAEMRGGTANCSVILSDKMIGSPMVQNKIDILCAMNQPSVDKFLPKIKDDGLALINTSIVTNKVTHPTGRMVDIDATNIAVKVGNPRVANMVMLAGFITQAQLFTLEDVTAVLEGLFGAKRPALIPLNIQAIKLGMEE